MVICMSRYQVEWKLLLKLINKFIDLFLIFLFGSYLLVKFYKRSF